MLDKLKSSLQDNDGTYNPAHIVAYALTAAVIVWVSWIVYHTRTMPDLQGPAFLLGGSGAMNVAHKFEDIVATFRKPS
jgi:hypothetical protein